MKRSELFFSVVLLPLDALMLLAAALSAYLIRVSPWLADVRPVVFEASLPFAKYLEIVLIMIPIWIGLFALSGLYKLKVTRHFAEELLQVAMASAGGVMALVFIIFLRHEFFDSRFIVLAAWFFAVLYVTAMRFAVRRVQAWLVWKYGIGAHRLLVIGSDKVTSALVRDIQSRPSGGYRVANWFGSLDAPQLKLAVAGGGVDEVVLGEADFSKETVKDIIRLCEEKHLSFKFVPSLAQTLSVNTGVEAFAGIPVIELRRTNLVGWRRVYKRIFDLAGGVVGSLVFLLIYLPVAFAIKWDTRGPALIKLRRVGWAGKEFTIYKFRSMYENTHRLKYEAFIPRGYNERRDGPLFKLKNDPRLTRVGRFIRKWRLDEFPQFLNVLMGDMSMVGPRPHEPEEVKSYQHHHKQLLEVKPGVTGLAQISGSSDLPFEEEVKLDIYYVENWSVWLDLKIVIRTVWVMLSDKSAV